MIKLRTFRQEDQSRLLDWATDALGLVHWAGATFKFPLTMEQLDGYRESATLAAPARQIFAALDETSGEVVGHVELSDVWPGLSARIARLLVDPGRRKEGLGGRIVEAAMDAAAEKFYVARVDLGFRLENEAAFRCYKKIGFRAIGFWPKAIHTDVVDIDVVWMSKHVADRDADYYGLLDQHSADRQSRLP